MTRSRILFTLLLVAAPSALLAQEHAAHEGDGHDDVTAAITAASEQFEAHWNAGDWEAVAAMYTENAMVMPPGFEPAVGPEAIAGMMASGPEGMSLDLTTKHVYSQEGIAMEVGNWVTTAADGSHMDHGNYMATWKWTEDGWKMTHDMWNSNMYPPGP